MFGGGDGLAGWLVVVGWHGGLIDARTNHQALLSKLCRV